MAKPSVKNSTGKLPKSPTGIAGLDEITFGGLPKGRPTLVCGSAGCGKTLLSLEFLIRGAIRYNEPGVFLAFEETTEELAKNVASLGYNLKELIAQKKLIVDCIHLDRTEIAETGEYDLDGLFLRLGHAIDSIGAKRVAIDTLEAIFSAFTNQFILRSELRRLFGWLKEKGVTAIITAERGDGALTRHGLEEYVSDCVIVLDHRVRDQISTRRLRILKYRGSHHGTNEYPFLIDESGISVLPITSVRLQHDVSNERISSGIPRLDAMLGGGYYRGSSILISGTAGTGKSSIAAQFANATCKRQERCLYVASEESPMQIVRNMVSIGTNLKLWVDKGLLRFQAVRPTFWSLETHLAVLHRILDEYKPSVVIVDPITNFMAIGNELEVKAMLTRLIDFLKLNRITGMFADLTTNSGDNLEKTNIGISSLMDTWLLLRDIEINSERNRGLYILKSRGMAHSNQMREFLLTDHGIDLLDVYVGPSGVLTGTAREAQEAQEKAAEVNRQQGVERQRRLLELKRKQLEAQIAALRSDFEAEKQELEKRIIEAHDREDALAGDRMVMARLRKADKLAPANGKKRLQGQP
jgi:circadian clock protein KaiC